MTKNISSNLLADIQKDVVTLATIMTIKREDGRIYRLTNHDTSIEFAGDVYDHSVPFTLSAMSSGTDLSVDNTDIRLALDDTIFTVDDFAKGRFYNAEVTIALVDFLNPEHGQMIIRRGWFGPISRQQNNVVKITTVGLLKVLDLQVGRVYQPSCDADLGDRRCRVAMDTGQAYSSLNRYSVGDWVYAYNDADLTAITLVNPSFESEITNVGDPITGWTQSPNAQFRVDDGGTFPNPTAGINALWGQYTGAGASERLEQSVHQDIDFVASGMRAADIDGGKLSFLFRVDLLQVAELDEPVRLKLDLFDADGNNVQSYDTGKIQLDQVADWRSRALSGPIIAGSRTARIYIYMYRETSNLIMTAADNVRLHWWNHDLGNPFGSRIHQCSRIGNFSTPNNPTYLANSSFDQTPANLVASGDQNIISWTKVSGSRFGSNTTRFGFNAQHGRRFIYSGDNLSGVQSTYTIRQDRTFTQLGLRPTAVVAGTYRARFQVRVLQADTLSTAYVSLDFINSSGTVISTRVVLNHAVVAVPGWALHNVGFSIPATTTIIRVNLIARSPIGVSEARIGFDDVRFFFVDAATPEPSDAISAKGVIGTVFDRSVGSFTQDGDLIWKARTFHLQYDEVSTVTDRKLFTGTNASGTVGSFTTGVIHWLSGGNAGQRNLIRLWTPGTKTIKLYFPSLSPIQPGDRFQIIRSCQKRFMEDCRLTFDNAVNFRGFPYLPGRG